MITLSARPTLQPIELAHGEGFQFTLRNGQTRTFVLESTAAQILHTNLKAVLSPEKQGGTILHFSCRARVDGHPLTLERYICTQESFYEPYVVNGMRIWFDAVSDLFNHMTENHGPCKLWRSKRARLAVQDATLPIAPEVLQDWCPREQNFIDIRECYNGDDCWMGPYQGADAHGGLDINHPRGTPLWAPFDLDDQYFYHAWGRYENNRWRGTRKWPDRSIWTIQVAHIVKLTVPEHEPVKAGTQYAEGAGVWVGDHNHSHFVFKVLSNGYEMVLDPWILFREIFENKTSRSGQPRAAMAPLSPARTGLPVPFRSVESSAAPASNPCSYFWSFGDGTVSIDPHPVHVYRKPGLYAVTLTVEAAGRRSACTQHLTVDGAAQAEPELAVTAPEEVSFRPRPVSAMDVYGWPVPVAPHTLEFVARSSRPKPRSKRIMLQNAGGGLLPPLERPAIAYQNGTGWVTLKPLDDGSPHVFDVCVNAQGLAPGEYRAQIAFESSALQSSAQIVRVRLTVRHQAPAAEVTIDDRDPECYVTPYFWVGHRFHRWAPKGHGDFYLTNGARSTDGEFARFTPDLQAGQYEVKFSDLTPFRPNTRFCVRVRHRDGDELVRMEPEHSRRIGQFYFEEGADGYVELLAGGSRGEVLVDAISFIPLDK